MSGGLVRAGALLIVAAIAIKLAMLGPGSNLLAEGPPRYEPADLLALVFSLAAGFALAGLAWRDGAAEAAPRKWETATILVLIAGSMLLTAVMAASPATFKSLVLEDGLVEWASAALLFAGAGAAGVALVRTRHARLIERLFLAGLTALLLLIGLEEVSWFQRLLGFATPDWLSSNWQGEFNFHNVSTSLSELIYYVGSALLLVGGRVLLALPDRPAWIGHFRRYAPATPALVAGALSCAFNWDLWLVVLIEAGFALAAGMLVVEAVVAWRAGRSSTAMLLILGLIAAVAVQVTFLMLGARMGRSWDATEARELLTAAGVALYALQFALAPRRAPPTKI